MLFGAGERKRSRRRSRSRSRRAGERKRSRSRRSRIRTAAKRFIGFGERKRSRRRSRRRSREMRLFTGLGERKRRRRSRSRRRSREFMPSFLKGGFGERRRSRRRHRRSREGGLFGGLMARRNGEFFTEVLKPGAAAAVGLVGTRLLSQQVAKLTASLVPSSPGLAKWVPTAVSGLSAWGVWKLSSKVGALRPYRGYLAIGAGLAVVEELLSVLLPLAGIAPGIPGMAGVLGNAAYGVNGGLGGGSLGFPCFTGSCPQGIAIPNNGPTPCLPGGSAQVYMTPGQQMAQAVAPGAASGMGFPCFTGSCPQGVQIPLTNPPCVDPSVTTAANVAVAASGFTDPVAQQVLAGLTNRAQEILSGAGM